MPITPKTGSLFHAYPQVLSLNTVEIEDIRRVVAGRACGCVAPVAYSS